MTFGCCGSITRPLVPKTGRRSVRGRQLWPSSVLDHKPPLAEQAKRHWLLVGWSATKFTRPMLGSKLGMFTGPKARQLETGAADSDCMNARGAAGRQSRKAMK